MFRLQNPLNKMQTVHLTYFKPCGKYYTEGEYKTSFLYLFDIIKEVEAARENNHLPGLQSGVWGAPILIRTTSEQYGGIFLLQ